MGIKIDGGIRIEGGTIVTAYGPSGQTWIVTNDSEFSNANSLATIGDIIQLSDTGTFSDLTLTNSSGVELRSQTPWVPIVRSLTINGARNARISGIRIQANSTPSTSPKLINLLNNVDGVTIEGCLIRGGNPWNSFSNFDPTVTDAARMGTNGSWGTTNPYATDLWYGIGTTGSGASLPVGNITIYNNTLLDLGGGIKWGIGTSASSNIKINGNVIGRCYQDAISLIFSSTSAQVDGIEICGNEIYDTFSQPQDNTNPHSDAIQIGAVGSYSYPMTGWLFAGNILWFSQGCRGEAQRLFTNDYVTGYPAVAPIIVDNVMMSRISSVGISLVGNSEGSAWGYIRRNIMLAKPTENTPIQNELYTNSVSGVGPSTRSPATIKAASSVAYGNPSNYIANNIAETFVSYPTDQLSNNITTGVGTSETSYQTYLNTNTISGWNAITNADSFLTALTPKPAYSANSPIIGGDTGISFRSRWAIASNRPWSSLPSWTAWKDLSGVTINSQQTSEWSFVHAGGPGSSRSISVVGGEYRIANDRFGSGSSAWTNSSGTISHGKFLQIRQTSSGSGATSSTMSVMIGSEQFNWSVTTVSTRVFPVVNFDSSLPALFRGNNGSSNLGTNGTVGTCALLGIKRTGAFVGTTLFATQVSTGNVVLSAISTTGILRVRLGSTIAQFNSSINIFDGVSHDILTSWDTSDPSITTGCDIYIDGISQKAAGGTWTTGTIPYSTNMQYQFGPASSAQSSFDLGAFYLNTAQRIDLSSSINRAKFGADVIGLDGSGPTGTAPVLFLTGNAAQWNAGTGINFGSGAKYIAQGAAAVTDVGPGNPWA